MFRIDLIVEADGGPKYDVKEISYLYVELNYYDRIWKYIYLGWTFCRADDYEPEVLQNTSQMKSRNEWILFEKAPFS